MSLVSDPGGFFDSSDVKICPKMSGALAPVAGGSIVSGPNQIAISPVFVPCQREKCAWWNGQSKRCGALPVDVSTELGNIAASLVSVDDAAQQFIPPSTGKSLFGRMVAAWERIAERAGE